MGEPYTINDKRGKEQPKPCCRVCGCADEHSKDYNNPTMSCIEYLRKRISWLEGERVHCYTCPDFIRNGTIPWCRKLGKEANGLAPICK